MRSYTNIKPVDLTGTVDKYNMLRKDGSIGSNHNKIFEKLL
jgi:hypothetical protein